MQWSCRPVNSAQYMLLRVYAKVADDRLMPKVYKMAKCHRRSDHANSDAAAVEAAPHQGTLVRLTWPVRKGGKHGLSMGLGPKDTMGPAWFGIASRDA